MNRYIAVDEIKRQWEIYGSLDVMDRIMADVFPTVDAVPVVHGHWERCMELDVEFEGHKGKIYNVRCTACGSVRQAFCEKYDYCPWCGAKMDEVTE